MTNTTYIPANDESYRRRRYFLHLKHMEYATPPELERFVKETAKAARSPYGSPAYKAAMNYREHLRLRWWHRRRRALKQATPAP